MTIQVGDDVAFRTNYGRDISIRKVTKITATGRIVVDDGNNGYTLNPDLTIRGNDNHNFGGPRCAEVVTQEMRDQFAKQNIVRRLQRFPFDSLNLAALQVIEQAIAAGTKKT